MFIHIGRTTFRITEGIDIDALAVEIVKMLKSPRGPSQTAAAESVSSKLEVIDGDDTLKTLTVMCMCYDAAYPQIGIIYGVSDITIHAKIVDRTGTPNSYVDGIYTVAVFNDSSTPPPKEHTSPMTSASNEMKYGCTIL